MKFLRSVFLLFCLSNIMSSSAARVDSFFIKHTEIRLSIRNFAAKAISGNVSHAIKFKVSTDALSLDLTGMTVDSVMNESGKLVFSRGKDKLNITLQKVFTAGDSTVISVYYRGTPASDPTGWGGFYFSGDFAFNLGVGFGVDPHSFGRAWFPCVDEFRMKSSYEFFIETDTNYVAACNGVLTDTQRLASSRVWHYKETKVLSAYLAAVSVSKFSILKSQYAGLETNFPVWLFCKPSDTNKIKASFVNLPKAIQAFETAFGPQIYGKVGYNFVPFNAGAMEHAGNITYPNIFADGTLQYEDLLAHELSHHWWGDNVTCVSEGDMWLNEGWASYCEHFFIEQVHGKAAYRRSVLENHLLVLRMAHINDEAVYPMVNIPHSKTYGTHVYKKGADVVHSLRGVLGDSVFFKACKAYQTKYRFGNATTADMLAVFEQNGGGSRATDFFSNWIYEKGFPHVIISKQVHSGNGPYNLKFFTQQRPRFTNKLYNNMPVEVFFFKDKNTYEKRLIVIDNQTDSFEFTFDFKPAYVCLDYDEKLSDAITDRTVITGVADTFDLPETFSRIFLKNSRDTSLIRVEHHWIGPELYRIKPPYMSDYRYYTLDGIWHDSLEMDLELSYDGRKISSAHLDHTLIYKTEDSLTVLYRAFPGDHWRVWPDLQFTYGNKFDKAGKVMVKHAKKGDYVFAMYDHQLDIPVYELNPGDDHIWSLSPNPTSDMVLLTFHNPHLPTMKSFIHVWDSSGKRIYSQVREIGQEHISINTRNWPAGVYSIGYYGKAFGHTKKLVICK
jgi:hypothetical protein